eukprot:jgi/Psemu1/17089/gm1.17089_g
MKEDWQCWRRAILGVLLSFRRLSEGSSSSESPLSIIQKMERISTTVTILDLTCLVESNPETETDTKTASFGKFQTPRSSYHVSYYASASSEDIDGDADCHAKYGKTVVRVYTIDATHAGTVWKKVRYGASWNQRVFLRAGTTSELVSVKIVLARAEFLMKRLMRIRVKDITITVILKTHGNATSGQRKIPTSRTSTYVGKLNLVKVIVNKLIF